MFVFQMQGFPVYEPNSDDDLAQWRPSAEAQFQFVHCAPHEYWIFCGKTFLGSAQQLAEGWQATAQAQGRCIAPLKDLVFCAHWLFKQSRDD